MRRTAGKLAGSPISWDQVRAFRLNRHHLSQRAPKKALTSVVTDMGGAQAQLVSAAQVSLWARTENLVPADVNSALWEDRLLAKAWCMRRTVHLLPTEHLAVFVRGTARRAEKEVRYVLNRGVTAERLEELLRVVIAVLDRPVTRSQLAVLVSRELSLPLTTGQWAGWGSRREVPCVKMANFTFPADFLLHLAGARGVLCAGPDNEGESTSVRADAWLPRWHDLPGLRAEQELLRLYLRAYGPATPSDFKAWTQMRLADARTIWTRLESELEPVDIEGEAKWILRADLRELEHAELPGLSVCLLPYFDSFLLGHERRGHLLEARHHPQVYRAQGWIAPVLLVNGRVVGVWTHTRKGDLLTVRVTRFSRLPSGVDPRVRAEAQGLARFLGCSGATTLLS